MVSKEQEDYKFKIVLIADWGVGENDAILFFNIEAEDRLYKDTSKIHLTIKKEILSLHPL